MIYNRASWRPYDLERIVTVLLAGLSLLAVQWHYLAVGTLLLAILVIFILYCRAAWD
jgi:hypothetical protein